MGHLARKAQAKNDDLAVVNALKGYYTEFGRYPLGDAAGAKEDWIDKHGAALAPILEALRGLDTPAALKLNPRRIAFMDVSKAVPKSFFGDPKSGLGPDGGFYDPWVNSYHVSIDANYDDQILAPDGETVHTGIIVWSLGKDGRSGTKDDVCSWK